MPVTAIQACLVRRLSFGTYNQKFKPNRTDADWLCSDEAELEQYRNADVPTESDELEVYRRAERTEREARERAAQIYAQTNTVLADATRKVDSATGEMAAQLQNCIAAADAAKALLQDAAQAMNAIRPEE